MSMPLYKQRNGHKKHPTKHTHSQTSHQTNKQQAHEYANQNARHKPSVLKTRTSQTKINTQSAPASSQRHARKQEKEKSHEYTF